MTEPLKNSEDRRAARHMSRLSHHHMARAVVAHKRIGGGFKSFFKKLGKLGQQAATHFVQHADTYANIGTGIAEATGLIDEETGEAIRGTVGDLTGGDRDEED